jgi:signal transduction histidine kinase
MVAAYLSTLTLDLQTILISISIVMNTVLGILIFSRRRDEYANKVYVFNIICIVWWSVMIVIYRLARTHLLGWTMGLYIAPTFIASSFLYFTFLFPDVHPRIALRRWYLPAIALANIAIVAATLMPGMIIQSVDYVPNAEKIIHFGWFYIAYASYISCFFGLGLFILAEKLMLIADPIKHRQILYLLWGYLLASTLAMVTNLTLPYLGIFVLNWLGQVFTVFMVLPVTYAIFKHRLFDVKVIATELITISLWIFLLARLLLDTSVRDRLVDGALLVIMLVIGSLLMRSVDREVRQRERIEEQERELEISNRQQESLLHFISHEIKGYLTKNEAAFAAVASGDFGEVSGNLKQMSENALADTRKGVDTVMDILDASNLKKGTVAYKKAPFDLCATVAQIVSEMKPAAKEKGIALSVRCSPESVVMEGDEDKIRRHVIRNIIDNAIKYTPQGRIDLALACEGGKAVFTSTDTGVGITPEDMKRLFTEGGHGAESIKVNVHSTGYGLYIAKQIVEAHGGTIRAESEGKGRGSKFVIELPLA